MEPAETPWSSETAYRALIFETLALAQQHIAIFDQDLSAMQLESSAGIALLSTFLSGAPQRQIRMVLHDPERMQSACPRLVRLFERFSHGVAARQTPQRLAGLADRLLLVDANHAVIRFHADHARGKQLLANPVAAGAYVQRFADLWEESTPVSLGTITGL